MMSLGNSKLLFLLQVKAWRSVGTTSYMSLIIYREQMITLPSWIRIKGYIENFRKELCSLEVCFCVMSTFKPFKDFATSRIRSPDIPLVK